MTARRKIDNSELLRVALETALSDVHVCMIAEVQKYTASKQRADVRPMVKKPIKGPRSVLFEELPVIPNVPVVFPRSGAFGLHVKLSAGDTVVLVFSEQSYSEWRQTSKLSKPFDLRRHSIGYPLAIPGVFAESAPLASLSGGNGMRLGNDSGDDQIRFDGDGAVQIGAGATKHVALAEDVSTNLVGIKTDLSALFTALAMSGTWTPSSTAATIAKAK